MNTRGWTVGAALGIAALAGLTSPACRPAEDPADRIRHHARALMTSEPSTERGDLEPLRDLVGAARIVGLGEATHGTHECFTLRHRFTEFLVQELGFDVIALEASMADARALDAFVQTGEGDPRQALAGLGSWIWYTEEMLDLVRWARAYNASGGHVRIAGFDMQQPRTSLLVVRDYFAAHEPERVADLERDYNVAYGAVGLATQRSVARVQAAFPGQTPAGRRVRLSGRLRTERVTDGFAGLWLRADGSRSVIDAMQDRAPRGTTDWREAAVEITVPPGTQGVVFGVQLTGDGTAWFDDLQFEIDGEPYEVPGLDFESPALPAGFAMLDADAGSGVDSAVARSGSSSLCLVYDAAARRAAARTMLEPSIDAARKVVERLEARATTLAPDESREELEWALQNARLIAQLLAMLAPGGVDELAGLSVVTPHPIQTSRDRSMAANVSWLREHLSEHGKVVLWAHNLHVSKRADWMGRHLAERFGDAYLALGFAFGTGKYRAVGGDDIRERWAAPPPVNSVEALLSGTGLPCFFLDLRAVAADAVETEWLETERHFRAVGPEIADEEFFPATIGLEFDALVYLDSTFPSIVASPPGTPEP